MEINLRIGGTTHPFLALQFLTGGRLDPASGAFRSPGGLAKFYRSTDNLKAESYRGLCPEDLIDITTINRLHFSHGTETGVLFHMIGALSQFGSSASRRSATAASRWMPFTRTRSKFSTAKRADRSVFGGSGPGTRGHLRLPRIL